MTIKMRLDTEGLRSLIENNPQLEIEIGREVMNNISSDQIKAKVEGQIDAVLKSMVTRGGSYYQPTYVVKDEAFLKAIAAASKAAVDASIGEAIKTQVADAITRVIGLEQARLRVEFRDLLREIVTPEMARDIMREKILL